jgi:hypothetical protein
LPALQQSTIGTRPTTSGTRQAAHQRWG